jgi:SLOG cluster3 family
MVNLFLSASIPRQDRPARYFDTADKIAIRDAVKALATVVVRKAHLYWGGHPSITPLIRDVVLKLDNSVEKLREHVTLYQSEEYRAIFPPDNFDFEDVIVIEKGLDKEDSNRLMREAMLNDKSFSAGIFIGGMNGVEAEFKMFRDLYPNAPVFPVASTGGSSKILYQSILNENPDPRLLTDYAYVSLFEDLLKPFLGLET